MTCVKIVDNRIVLTIGSTDIPVHECSANETFDILNPSEEQKKALLLATRIVKAIKKSIKKDGSCDSFDWWKRSRDEILYGDGPFILRRDLAPSASKIIEGLVENSIRSIRRR